MQQVIQNARSGRLDVASVPEPLVYPGHVLIANVCSVISAGTEKSVIDLARKSLLGKARERPDLVRRILQKCKTEGFFKTVSQVLTKLHEPMPLGYASAGTVLACGEGVQEFKPGDRVASNGSHAEVVCVPKHLCARVPRDVPFEHACFSVLGSIALQGVRLCQLGLQDTVLVIGLGLLGQIAIKLLKAHGCRVLATDLDSAKCALARERGADHAAVNLGASDVFDLTQGRGADAVLITAATKSDGPVDLASRSVRRKGRVVIVGAVGLNLTRQPFYLSEAELVVSCSYGPGRYDPEYEERGHDYPVGFVRWTEQRNMDSVLALMSVGKLDIGGVITHRFPVEQAAQAYDLIETGHEPYLGIVLNYAPHEEDRPRRVELKAVAAGGGVGIGCLGAGQFASGMLLPILAKNKRLEPLVICSGKGVSASAGGQRTGFATATADEDEVFRDPNVKAVFIITRHNQHAAQVIKGLRAGKHVFVEKPLAIKTEEILEIEQAILDRSEPAPVLLVGFNRRFSPAAKKVKEFFAPVKAPLTVSIRFNSGAMPVEHWAQDEAIGGGRIIGEACHALDLATYLAGSCPVRVYAESIGGPDAPEVTDDQCFITLRHANGSVSSIAYLAGGDKVFPKERVEVFGGGRIAVIDDFREVITSVNGRTEKTSLGVQDKGHRAEIEEFARVVTEGGGPPISWEALRAVSLASILAVRSIREGVPLEVPG